MCKYDIILRSVCIACIVCIVCIICIVCIVCIAGCLQCCFPFDFSTKLWTLPSSGMLYVLYVLYVLRVLYVWIYCIYACVYVCMYLCMYVCILRICACYEMKESPYVIAFSLSLLFNRDCVSSCLPSCFTTVYLVYFYYIFICVLSLDYGVKPKCSASSRHRLYVFIIFINYLFCIAALRSMFDFII